MQSMRRSHSSSDLSELSQQSSSPLCRPSCRGSSIDFEVAKWPGDREDPSVNMELLSPLSQPIPIHNCCHNTQELEENESLTHSLLLYEHATWRMYTRIITARQLRAASRPFPSHREKHLIMQSFGNCLPLAPEHANAYYPEACVQVHLQRNLIRQQPSADEDFNLGVFVLEM